LQLPDATFQVFESGQPFQLPASPGFGTFGQACDSPRAGLNESGVEFQPRIDRFETPVDGCETQIHFMQDVLSETRESIVHFAQDVLLQSYKTDVGLLKPAVELFEPLVHSIAEVPGKALPAAHELNDFNFRPGIHYCRGPQIPLYNSPVELHRHPFGFQMQSAHHLQ
jgi:hypothetical protein